MESLRLFGMLVTRLLFLNRKRPVWTVSTVSAIEFVGEYFVGECLVEGDIQAIDANLMKTV